MCAAAGWPEPTPRQGDGDNSLLSVALRKRSDADNGDRTPLAFSQPARTENGDYDTGRGIHRVIASACDCSSVAVLGLDAD